MTGNLSRSVKILSALKRRYSRADCALNHQTPFQLLAATILSAQCTDQRVNMVTPALFAKYPTPQKLGRADVRDVERIIHSTGFYRQKALSLVTTSRLLTEKFGGEVPRRMEDLLTLRGVARKTANVVLGVCFRIAEGVVVDTHVTRLANRMGFTRQKDPVKIEKDLMETVPKRDWIWISHALITHGRGPCKALRPDCTNCPLEPLCPKRGL